MPKSQIELNQATESISISLPGWLNEMLEDICQRKDFTKSTFCKRALKKAILLSYTDDLALWNHLYTGNGHGVLAENNENSKK